MLAALTLLLLSADPAPALKSLQGLNVGALKPWLIANLASLSKCGKPGDPSASDEVTVRAQFSSSPDVKVERVDGALSDAKCVKAAVEAWKNDGKQPRAGPFSFTYRFRPTATK